MGSAGTDAAGTGAAGTGAAIDTTTPAGRLSFGIFAALAEFERELGFERLVAVHANDSKQPLGGLRDRHENIGDGFIGLEGFAAVMRHPAFADVPFLLEVPGIAGNGPDVENVMRLKAIRAGVGLGSPPNVGPLSAL